jgi:hypothetical protein
VYRIEDPHIRLDLETVPEWTRQRPQIRMSIQSSMRPTKLPKRATTHNRGSSNDQSNQNLLQFDTVGSQPRMQA